MIKDSRYINLNKMYQCFAVKYRLCLRGEIIYLYDLLIWHWTAVEWHFTVQWERNILYSRFYKRRNKDNDGG